MKEIAIIMGSSSDLGIMSEASNIITEFGLEAHVEVVSAHRTPEKMVDFGKNAKQNGFKVIIAGAGGAAHLPGMVAALTTLPVIGVPIKSSNSIQGIDSLLSIAQMPGGVPVATVAVNGAMNAGLLAVQILGTANAELAEKLDAYKGALKDKVQKMNDEL